MYIYTSKLKGLSSIFMYISPSPISVVFLQMFVDNNIFDQDWVFSQLYISAVNFDI